MIFLSLNTMSVTSAPISAHPEANIDITFSAPPSDNDPVTNIIFLFFIFCLPSFNHFGDINCKISFVFSPNAPFPLAICGNQILCPRVLASINTIILHSSTVISQDIIPN